MNVSSRVVSGGVASVGRTQLIFTLVGMTLALLLTAMDQAIVSIALPRVVASLSGFARYPWVITSHLLTSTIAIPVFAKLSDLYGRKWFYLSGPIILVVCLLFCGASGNIPLPIDGMNQLILFRGILGVGNGAILSLTYTVIGDLFQPAERGRYQGLFAGVYGLAFLIGPGLGGWITEHFSWRWAFWANVPLGVAAVVVLYFTFPNLRPAVVRHSIDWTGIAALCGWVVPLLLALTWVGRTGWTDRGIQATLGASGLMLLVFLLVEKRAVEPLIPLTLFRDPTVALALASWFLLSMALFGLFIYLPLFTQAALSASAIESGSLITLLALASTAANFLVGHLIAHTGRYKALAIVGAFLAGFGIFLLAQMDGKTTHFEMIRNVVLCGIGFGTIEPIYTMVVQNAAPREQMGVATASTRFFLAVGGTIGLALFGTVLLRLYHHHLDALIPPGTPRALTQPFDNPVQLFLMHTRLEASFSRVPHGQALLATLLEGARSGLVSALHVIFLVSAGLMTITLGLNFLLKELPLRSPQSS
jgi:EmrB/QacA subfamily drug resistance transporter